MKVNPRNANHAQAPTPFSTAEELFLNIETIDILRATSRGARNLHAVPITGYIVI